MFPFKSIWARLVLIVPALIIAYFVFLYLGSAAEKAGYDLLGTGTAQEQGTQQQTRDIPVSAEMASALRAKADELDKREQDISRKEQELAVFERDLLRMRQQISGERAQLDAAKAEFERQEAERASQRINLIAQAMKNTKSDVAAAQLAALYKQNRVTALFVLSQLDSRSAGKIFSKFADTLLAAQILEEFKAWRVSQETEGSATISH